MTIFVRCPWPLPISLDMASPPCSPTPGARLTTEQIYRQYLPYVRHFVQRGVDPQHWDDLVQEVFCAIERTYSNFDPARPIKPWIKTIALRIVRDFHERKGEELEDEEDLVLEELIELGPSVEIDEDDADRKRLVATLLEALDEEELRVVQRTWLEEGLLLEVAEELGYTEGELIVVRRRALRKMKAAYDRQQATQRRKLRDSRAFAVPLALILHVRAWIARARSFLGHALARTGVAASGIAPASAIAIGFGAAVVPPILPSAALEKPSPAIAAPIAARVEATARSAPLPAISAEVPPSPLGSPRAVMVTAPSASADVIAEQRSLARIRAAMDADPAGAFPALDRHKKIFSPERLREDRELIEALARMKSRAARQAPASSPRP